MARTYRKYGKHIEGFTPQRGRRTTDNDTGGRHFKNYPTFRHTRGQIHGVNDESWDKSSRKVAQRQAGKFLIRQALEGGE